MMHDEYCDEKFEYEPNRGYFSEALVQKDIEIFDEYREQPGKRPIHYGMLSRKMFTEKCTPILHAIPDPQRRSTLQPALRWKQYSTRVALSFPIQTIKPKVQLVYIARPGCIPREVEVERRLRQYSKKSINIMITDAGVDLWTLVPAHVMSKYLTSEERNNQFSAEHSQLPLEWFDDFEYDCMRPEDWLNLGTLHAERHPLPADAFLPSEYKITAEQAKLENRQAVYRNKLYEWVKVCVREYDPVRMRWLVQNLQSANYYRIPRIFLMFLAEDPANFIERIQHAQAARNNADRRMKFELVLDTMILTGVPQPPLNLIRRISELSASVRLTKQRASKVIAFLEDVKLDYQRVLGGIELRQHLCENHATYDFIELPDEEVRVTKQYFQDHENGIANYAEAHTWLRINTLYCLPPVINAMDTVVVECDLVSNMCFFTANILKTASLEDFRVAQEVMSSATVTFIKTVWIENMSGMICMSLRSVGKGWFDIRMNDWTIYKFSKMYRFLLLVQQMMQIALRNLVEGSIRMWMQLLCKPCECLIHVKDDFVWNSQDLITSPFVSGTLHVFYMVLQIDEDGPFYTTDPLQYEPVLLELFDVPMTEAHFVHLIDPRVMEYLVFADDLHLSSVGTMEAVVAEARALLQLSYQKGAIPLIAYLRQFERYCEFFLMDKMIYLRDFKAADHSPQEYQDEISLHFRMKQNLEVTLPSSIQVGPFLINVDPLKVFLVNKRQELATKLIDLLMEKLRTETQMIVDEYMDIIRRLSEKPLTIEQIFETREWMETLPDHIQVYENQMRLKLFEYDIMDYFWVALSNDDFKIKWNALAGPLKCYKQMVATREMYEEETERFQKQQIGDLGTYDERVEGLNMTVSTFSSTYDTNKTTEISIDIKKLWKQITETMDLGRLLNKRQLLFENPPVDLTPIEQLRDSFSPYKTLWVTGADFLKWEEAWLGNPLPNVVIENIRQSVDEYKTSILECIEIFAELPKVQEVALYFQRCIEEFEPKLNVLDWIKNPDWIMVHWQELGKTTGLEIKFSLNINFDYCIAKGIMNFYDEVRDISEAATRNKDALEAQMLEDERLKREAEEEILARKNRRRGRKLETSS